jgi:tetratricopeptide (TPR) repeat protein
VGILAVLLACASATVHAQAPSWSERIVQSTAARQAGDYERAEALLVDALADAETEFGAADARVATTLNALASLYEGTGRASAAESLYVRSLAIIEAALGPGHLEVATTLNALGTLYLAEGRFAEAEPILARSLAIYRSLPGGWPRASATVLNNLAVARENLGKLVAAESAYAASIRLKQQVQGAHDPALAAPLSNLAALHQRRRDFRAAETLYTRALEIQQRAYGADYPDLIPTLINLALTYERLETPDSAVANYERARASYEVNGLERDLLYATLAANLGTIQLARERYGEAEQRRGAPHARPVRVRAAPDREGRGSSGGHSTHPAAAEWYAVVLRKRVAVANVDTPCPREAQCERGRSRESCGMPPRPSATSQRRPASPTQPCGVIGRERANRRRPCWKPSGRPSSTRLRSSRATDGPCATRRARFSSVSTTNT